MALTKLTDLLEDAKDGQYAVGMFVMYNVEFLQGLIQAAEEMHSPIFIAYGELAEDVSSIKHFSKTVLSMIEDTKVPIGFHWDHASSLDVVKLAVESGFTSVMIDASAHPLEENIRITKEVVEYCKPLGIPVEGELGCVGQGANYDPEKYIYTDPQEAVRFVKETGIDALAVAIGNSHGVYACKPKLNFEVLKEIIAQFFNIGAQIAVWSFVIRYAMVQLNFDGVLASLGDSASADAVAVSYTHLNAY